MPTQMGTGPEPEPYADDATRTVPGFEGSVGPGPGQYGSPHVYARDVHSGAGNCVCGGQLGHRLHTETAPGVPIPGWARPGRQHEAVVTTGPLWPACGGDPYEDVIGRRDEHAEGAPWCDCSWCCPEAAKQARAVRATPTPIPTGSNSGGEG